MRDGDWPGSAQSGKGLGSRSGRDRARASEFQRQGARDGLAVSLDLSEGELGVEPVFELGDPALGPVHPSGNVLLG